MKNGFLNTLEGIYATQATDGWTTFFSPLVIGPGNLVSLAGNQIEYDYNPATSVLKFGPIPICHGKREVVAHGVITFSQEDGSTTFSGSIQPDTDKPVVSFQGSRKTKLASLQNIAGTYDVDVESLGKQLSPLEIGLNGNVTLGGDVIAPSYDPDTGLFVFDSAVIQGAVAKGSAKFKINGGNVTFKGQIQPNPDDGLMKMSGSIINRKNIVNWKTPMPGLQGNCALKNGFLWILDSDNNSRDINSFDQISGARGLTISMPKSTSALDHIQSYGELLAVSAGNLLYTVDPQSGQASTLSVFDGKMITWLKAHNGSLYVGTTSPGKSNAMDAIFRFSKSEQAGGHDQQGPWTANIVGEPVVAGEFLCVPVIVNGKQIIQILDAQTFESKWAAYESGINDGRISSDGRRLAVCDMVSNTLDVFNLSTEEKLGSFSLPGLGPYAPILKGNFCYVMLDDYWLKVVDLKEGVVSPGIKSPFPPRTQPLMNDAGVYFVVGNSSIAAIDTSSGPEGGIVEYETAKNPRFYSYRHGTLFYSDSKNVGSVRLDGQVHQHYVESSLIRDFDFSSGAEKPESVPNFQVEISLTTDDGGTPRANQPVRLTAASATTISCLGQSYPISQSQFVDLQTDGTGRLRISVPAGSVDDKGEFYGGLTAPDLMLTSPFMDPNMRFVIRPNGEMSDHLANINEKQLTDATGYDSKPIIDDEFRDDPARMSNLTKAINQTVGGMVRPSMRAQRTRSIGNMYCNPACHMAVACCLPSSADQPGVVCNQSYRFDLSENSHFSLLSEEEATALIGSAPQPEEDFDLWTWIKQGAANVVSAVVTLAEEGAKAYITAVYKGDEIKRRILIDSVEKAVLLVQGIFNTVVSAINKVVEAISFLFNWDKVLTLHAEIKSQVTNAWGEMTPAKYQEIKDFVSTTLGTFEKDANAAFDRIKELLGVRSGLEAQEENSKKSNVAQGSAQDNWMLGKFQDQALGPVPSNSGSATMNVLAAQQTNWPELKLGPDIVAAFDKFSTKLSATVGSKVSATIDLIWNDLDFSSDPGVLARALSAVVDAIRGLVIVTIEVVNAVVDLLVSLLEIMSTAMLDFLNEPLTIPYLTDFYYWLTGEELTLLDMFSLLVAIPGGFATSLMGREPAYASGVSPSRPNKARLAVSTPQTRETLEILAGTAQIVWGVIWGVSVAADVIRTPPGYKFIAGSALRYITKVRIVLTVVSTVVVRGLFLAVLIVSGASVVSYVLWAIPTLDMVTITALLCLRGTVPEIGIIMSTLSCALGMLMIGVRLKWLPKGKPTPHNIVLACAGVSSGLALIMRVGIPYGSKTSKFGCIAASAIFMMVTGALEIAVGTTEPVKPPA